MKKVLLVIFILLASCGLAPKYDIEAVFANAGEGDTINIPAGVHVISNSLKPKSNQVIFWNNAQIKGDGDFPLVDFSGASRVTSYNLRTHTDSHAQAAVWLSRSPQGHGGGNVFIGGSLDGHYSVATVWSNSEGNRYNNVEFFTRTQAPALIYNGSNTGDSWRDCVFRNYGEFENVAMIQLGQTTSDLIFDGGYIYLGVNGTAFQATGTASDMTFKNIRVEGEGARSLFLDNVGTSTLYWYHIEKINWTIKSDYMIHAPLIIYESTLDFTWGVNNAERYIHTEGSGPRVWRCRIYGNKADWITLDNGAQIRMSWLYWTQGSPLPVVGDNIVEWTQ